MGGRTKTETQVSCQAEPSHPPSVSARQECFLKSGTASAIVPGMAGGGSQEGLSPGEEEGWECEGNNASQSLALGRPS